MVSLERLSAPMRCKRCLVVLACGRLRRTAFVTSARACNNDRFGFLGRAVVVAGVKLAACLTVSFSSASLVGAACSPGQPNTIQCKQ